MMRYPGCRVCALTNEDTFASGDRLLIIEAEHVVAAEELPAHHQEPFDRLLVARALEEPLRLMTPDPFVARRCGDAIIKV